MNSSRIKLIAVSLNNYESLRKFGEFGDSFNDIITKILDKVDTLPSATGWEIFGMTANESESNNDIIKDALKLAKIIRKHLNVDGCSHCRNLLEGVFD